MSLFHLIFSFFTLGTPTLAATTPVTVGLEDLTDPMAEVCGYLNQEDIGNLLRVSKKCYQNITQNSAARVKVRLGNETPFKIRHWTFLENEKKIYSGVL